MYKIAKCNARLRKIATTSFGLAQTGKVRRDSDCDRAFMAFIISMTTRMLNDIVDAFCVL